MSLADYVLGRLRSALPGVPVYDRQVPDDGTAGEPPDRYVVVWMPSPDRQSSDVSGRSTNRNVRWQTTSVAPDRGMAEWLSDRVCAVLVDHRPVVDGWAPGPIQYIQSYMASEQQPEVHDLVLARQRVSLMDRFEVLADVKAFADDIGS